MKNRKKSNVLIIINLIKLLKTLWILMFVAIFTGVLGFIFSFGISLSGSYAILSVIPSTKENLRNIFLGNFSTNTYFFIMIFCGFFRAILHYLEQYCNHHIAFHILAEIRVKLFRVMRKLAPAKIEGKEQGNLISMITADIELLEIFYAHTISPIMIAFFTSIILFMYYLNLYYIYSLYMLISQFFIAIIIPYFALKRSEKTAMNIRNDLGELNNKFLDNLRGIKEIIQFSQGKNTLKNLKDITFSLANKQKKLRSKMAEVQIATDSSVIFFSLIQLLISIYLVSKNIVSIEVAILAGILQVGSYAPYINLANLGNILSQTFACGDRILNLIEEKPTITESNEILNVNNSKLKIENFKNNFNIIDIKNISFKYPNSHDLILKNINIKMKRGELLGIMGESGCGKSTLLKLIMRFWDSDSGTINIKSQNIKNISVKNLYENFSYMTQSTNLFIGTLRDNLLIAKSDATDDEIFLALKKASFYDYVISLPNKLDTIVEESGKNFSGGEKQRIGLARSFLANREIFLLDEPTSNLDLQNEAIILKSLVEEAKDKSIILVSHRESTLSICDRILKMENGVILN